ncbi:uncharacterized protein LOC144406268 [Gasterosteus aculeatus]
MTNVQQKDTMPEKMEVNSKVVDPPMNFYLRSLEEQARVELKDSRAKLTQTESVGRVLLQIDEDRLQQFLDLLQEYRNGDVHKEMCSLKAQLEQARSKIPTSLDGAAMTSFSAAKTNLELKNDLEIERAQTKKQHMELTKLSEALRNEQEAVKNLTEDFQAFHMDRMRHQRAETEKMAAALKTALGENVPAQQVTTKQNEMELHKDCKLNQAKQTKAIIELTAALKKSEQDQKNAHRQWQQEKSSLTCQLEKQKVETIKNTEVTDSLLETFRQQTTSLKTQLNSSREETLHKLQTQDKINRKLTVALKKTLEDQLESEHLKWKQEKECLQSAMLKNSFDQNNEKGKNKDLLAAVEKAEQQLESRTIEWEQERTSFKARLEKTCQDLEHAQLRNITAVLAMEKEAVEMFERNQASHNQLEEQRAETNKITRALKKTADLLEKQSFSFQQLTLQLETSCATKLEAQQEDHNNLLAALRKKFEDERESECLQWHETNSFLTQTAEQSLEREKEHLKDKTCLLSQLAELQQQIPKKPKKKWYKLF